MENGGGGKCGYDELINLAQYITSLLAELVQLTCYWKISVNQEMLVMAWIPRRAFPTALTPYAKRRAAR